MRNFKLYGHATELDIALLTAHPRIWDESRPYALTKSDLKYLPFISPTASDPKQTASMLKGRWKVQYAGGDEETYTFNNNAVSWSGKQGKGDGFWVMKNNKITISWRNTGSTEVWMTGASDSTAAQCTLNFGRRGAATKTA